MTQDYSQNVLFDRRGAIGVLTLNRPQKRNALNAAVMDDIARILKEMDEDPSLRVGVVLGAGKTFAAGVDISQMKDITYPDTYAQDFLGAWQGIGARRKPLVCGVLGHALGGGCEFVMMCDIVVAAQGAQFGQPEIKLGVIPGMGGTQRLVRAIGKAKAMEMILTGRLMGALEAEASGLISRVVPEERLEGEVFEIAEKIASFPLGALLAAKETVNRAFEVPLQEGLLHERRVFQALFGTADQREGMAAFLEKRPARFHGEDG